MGGSILRYDVPMDTNLSKQFPGGTPSGFEIIL